jgi:hypothetical protein
MNNSHSGIGKSTLLSKRVNHDRHQISNWSVGKTTVLAEMLNPSSELSLPGMIDPKGDETPPLTLIDPKGATFKSLKLSGRRTDNGICSTRRRNHFPKSTSRSWATRYVWPSVKTAARSSASSTCGCSRRPGWRRYGCARSVPICCATEAKYAKQNRPDNSSTDRFPCF